MSGEGEIRFRDLIAYFYSCKYLIISVSIGFSVIAALISLAITPVYSSQAILAPVSKSEENSSYLSRVAGSVLSGLDFQGFSQINDSASVQSQMTSRVFAEMFIKENNLLPILFEEEWDKERSDWKKDIEKPSPYTIQKKFRDSYSIVKDLKTGLMVLTVDWSDKEIPAVWANKLIEAIESYTRKLDIIDGENSIKYLREELSKTSNTEIKLSLYSLIEKELKKIMLAKTQTSYVYKVIDPAYEPEFRSWPRRKFITLLGLFMGFLASSLYVFIRFFYKRDYL